MVNSKRGNCKDHMNHEDVQTAMEEGQHYREGEEDGYWCGGAGTWTSWVSQDGTLLVVESAAAVVVVVDILHDGILAQ